MSPSVVLDIDYNLNEDFLERRLTDNQKASTESTNRQKGVNYSKI